MKRNRSGLNQTFLNKENQAKLSFKQQNFAIGESISISSRSIQNAYPRMRDFSAYTHDSSSESEHLLHWDLVGNVFALDKNAITDIINNYKSYCEAHNGIFEGGTCRRIADNSYLFLVEVRSVEPRQYESVYVTTFDINAFEWKTPDQNDYVTAEYFLDTTLSVGYKGMYVTKASKIAEYRRFYSLATNQDMINRFIAQYQNDDPEGLVPQAKARLQQIYADGAKKVEQEAIRKAQESKRIAAFRKSLSESGETNCGPVIELKGKLVKVSFAVSGYGNEHWIRRDEIFPAGYGCKFMNGQYQVPQ